MQHPGGDTPSLSRIVGKRDAPFIRLSVGLGDGLSGKQDADFRHASAEILCGRP